MISVSNTRESFFNDTSVHTRLYHYTYTCIHARVHNIHMLLRTYAHRYIPRMYMYHACTYVMHIHSGDVPCICVHNYVCSTYAYDMPTCMSYIVNMHTYIHTCMQCIHTCIHMNTYMRALHTYM